MPSTRTLAAAAFAALSIASAPTLAQPLSANEERQAIDFVIANIEHTLYHEVGHLFVDVFGLPVLGKEEDAVDIFATLIMLEHAGGNGASALVDVADSWRYSQMLLGVEADTAEVYAAEHSMDIQRAFSVVCLAVGRDRKAHAPFASRFGITLDRQDTCQYDHDLAHASWEQLLGGHTLLYRPGAEVDVAYRLPDLSHMASAVVLADHRILEYVAEWLYKSYVLPEPVTLVAEMCGEANAFYNREDREIILCYELVSFQRALFIEHVLPARRAESASLKRTQQELGSHSSWP